LNAAEESGRADAKNSAFFRYIDTLYDYLNDEVVTVSQEDLLLYQSNYPYVQAPPHLVEATNLLYSFLTQIYGVYLFDNVFTSSVSQPFIDTVIESQLRLRVDFALIGPNLEYDLVSTLSDHPDPLFPSTDERTSDMLIPEHESQFSFKELSLLSGVENLSREFSTPAQSSLYRMDYEKKGLVEDRRRGEPKEGSKEIQLQSHDVFSQDYFSALIGSPVITKRLVTHSTATVFLSLKGNYQPTIFSCMDLNGEEIIPDYSSQKGRESIYSAVTSKIGQRIFENKLTQFTGLNSTQWDGLAQKNAPINFSTLCAVSNCLKTSQSEAPFKPFT
jgi:hypothetical protein